MSIEKQSIKIIFITLGVLLIGAGLLAFGLDLTGWVMSVATAGAGLILLSEVGLKKFTQLSKLKSFGLMQYVTLTFAFLLGVSAILNIPLLSIQVEVLSTVTSIAFIGAGVMFIVEAIGIDIARA